MDNTRQVKEEIEAIEAEKLKVRKANYEQWLTHPITREYLVVLSNHESILIDSTVEEPIRTLASIRTVRAIRKCLLKFELFDKLFTN